jgi:hypothetical protein
MNGCRAYDVSLIAHRDVLADLVEEWSIDHPTHPRMQLAVKILLARS